MTDLRLRFAWCVLTGVVISISILPGNSSIYQVAATPGLNRWVHFLAYAGVAAIPLLAWRLRSTILISLAIVMLGPVFDSLQAIVPGLIARPEILFADLFGVAAGILLGLNVRVMFDSAKSSDKFGADPLRSTIRLEEAE